MLKSQPCLVVCYYRLVVHRRLGRLLCYSILYSSPSVICLFEVTQGSPYVTAVQEEVCFIFSTYRSRL